MPLPQRRYRNVYERIDQVIICFLVFNFIIIIHGINRSYVPELGLFLNFINCFKGITAFILREKKLIRLFLTQKNNWFILVNVNSRPKLITLLDILSLNIERIKYSFQIRELLIDINYLWFIFTIIKRVAKIMIYTTVLFVENKAEPHKPIYLNDN